MAICMSEPLAKQYIKDFENLGFGVFVHFGLYSLTEAGEWTYKLHNRNMDEYKKLMEKFNPGNMESLVHKIKKRAQSMQH